MFFSTYVLTKKGPLAKVWLAAHWEKKLTRNEVKLIDLKKTILYIVRPVVPIALRTSGELLVGVVRIYALKVKHLLKEATEATYFLRVSALSLKGNGKSAEEMARRGHKSELEAVTLGVDGKKQLLLTHTSSNNTLSNNLIGTLGSSNGNASNKDNNSISNNNNNNNIMQNSRFASLAELINNTRLSLNQHDNSNNNNVDMDNVNLAAWYTMQPNSQGYNGVEDGFSATQQEYDEIAKMRADLMAFGARAPSSSTSKSKSSLSSMEKGRGSALDQAAMTLNYPATQGNWDYMHNIPYPDLLGGNQFNPEELDIGVPLPDDVQGPFPFMSEVQEQQQLQQQQQQQQINSINNNDDNVPLMPRPRRNANTAANVLDMEATTLSREEVEANMQNRHDIVESIPFIRHGPWNETEVKDRTITALGNNVSSHQNSSTFGIVMHAIGLDSDNTCKNNTIKTNVVLNDFVTLARVEALNTFATSPLLRNVFESTIARNIEFTAGKYSTLLSSSSATTRNLQKLEQEKQQHNSSLIDQDDIPAGEEANGEFSNRKRPRNDVDGNLDYTHDIDAGRGTTEMYNVIDNKEQNVNERGKANVILSSGTIQTLERVKAIIQIKTTTSNTNKRSRTENINAATACHVSSCTINEVCTGLRRRDVAKTFVNILALASQQLLKAEQRIPNVVKSSMADNNRSIHMTKVHDIVLTLRDNVTLTRVSV